MHVGLDQHQQPLDVRIAEHNHVVDAAQRADELGAIGGRQNRAARPFQRRHRPIVVDRHDQAIRLGRRPLQVPDVADMEQIEAAVRERDVCPAARSRATASTSSDSGKDHVWTTKQIVNK